jgi:glycosyltransferase involved in cell wall biosynthesis
VPGRLDVGHWSACLARARKPGQLTVLHVVEASLGGVRAYLRGLAVACSDTPISWQIAYAPNRADSQFWSAIAEMRSLGWQAYEIPMLREVRPRADVRSARELRELMKLIRPDIVHTHSSKAGALGRLAAGSLGPGRPALIHAPHALPLALGRVYQGAEWVLGHSVTDVVTAMCESERQQIIDAGVFRGLVRIARPYVDSAHYRPLDRATQRSIVGAAHDTPLVVGIGRLADQKDPLTFVRAVAKARPHVAGLRAVWVGEGELRSDAEDLAAGLGLGDGFCVTGWVSDVRPYIGASDVVLVPSKYESFGYVTAEALSMGRPVVGTAVPGTVDLITSDKLGDILPCGDVESLASALVRRISHPGDSDPGYARETIESNYGAPAVRNELLAIYAAAVSARRPTRIGPRRRSAKKQ